MYSTISDEVVTQKIVKRLHFEEQKCFFESKINISEKKVWERHSRL